MGQLWWGVVRAGPLTPGCSLSGVGGLSGDRAGQGGAIGLGWASGAGMGAVAAGRWWRLCGWEGSPEQMGIAPWAWVRSS